MTYPRAKSLFHFTPRFDYLTDILKTGFWPRFCREEYEWLVGSQFSVRIPMVCFCDIPLSRIKSHTAFYGTFGLGMTRTWGIQKKLNPIAYIKNGSSFWKSFRKLHLIQGNMQPRHNNLSMAFASLLCFTKAFRGSTNNRGVNAPVNKEFYQECEWRHVLERKNVGAFLTSNVVSVDQRMTTRANNLSKRHPLSFKGKDIRYLLVPSEAYIDPLVDLLLNDTTLQFTKAERLLLITRIQVLSSLQKDL